MSDVAGYTLANIDVEIDPDASRRVWARDSSYWGPGDDDPASRLGWLESHVDMAAVEPDLVAFADEAVGSGPVTVVLLGMGGSALAPEVFARTLEVAAGRRLILCDSTHPAEVARIEAALDFSRCLFVVSSKSGTTVETSSLYRLFRSHIDDGSRFVAITDPGTPLHQLALAEGFLATFTNRRDIGGRYSALSYFGIVPAALLGVDLAQLLRGAREMAELCSAAVPAEQNPGAVLGSLLGRLAERGNDKLTLVISSSHAAFGDWVEQLVAESTGKRGRGICPVVGEPLVNAETYGSDRTFVHIRSSNDDTHDDFVATLAGKGHPVIRIDVDSSGSLGAEIFRWEFAVAVASAVMGINAFDQPDVEAAKASARAALESEEQISWPEENPDTLFDGLAPPELPALLLFAPSTDETRAALAAARRRLVTRTGAATSAGLGPRYLHSTGQLHKGGPKNVRALVVLDPPAADIPVPGAGYGFARLVTAQAQGDVHALRAADRRVASTTFRRFKQWAGE